MADTQSFLNAQKDRHERKSKYPRFNLQAGDKTRQLFYARLMPRLGPDSERCNGPYAEWFAHFGCGADGDTTLVCRNETIEQSKKNVKRCQACSDTRKVLRDKEAYDAKTVEIAKRKSNRTRIFWPVYDMEKRKSVEILEISGVRNTGNRKSLLEKIIDEFKDAAGDFFDLTNLRQPCALEIERAGSGQYCDYTVHARFGPKYALTAEDIKNIKATYILPEKIIDMIRQSDEEFLEIWHSDVSVVSEDPEQAETVAAPATVASEDALNDLLNMGGATGQAFPAQAEKPAESPRQAPSRQRPGAPAGQPAPLPPVQAATAPTIPSEEDLLAELDKMTSGQ